jgi:LuxR family maltose regulon positive regulatory protein
LSAGGVALTHEGGAPAAIRRPRSVRQFVSVNTIRTHMRHLYTKLGVHRRADAVQRARELGLLAPGSNPR